MSRLSPVRLLRLDSVRGKVITSTVILILVILGSVLTLLGLSQVNALSRAVDDSIDIVVKGIRDQVRDSLFDEDDNAIRGLLIDLQQSSTVHFVVVCDTTGAPTYKNIDTSEFEQVLEHPEFREALEAKGETSIRTTSLRDGGIRTEVKPVMQFNSFLGLVLVGFKVSIEQSEQRRQQGIVILGIIAIIIGTAFAALFASSIISPIERLKSAAQRIGEGEFGETV
ncbi:hypothetical protein ACFL3H_09380, partial [Gemmatimonadota bacterium]